MPTVGSLFSGVGGLDLGLERAGWKVRWQVEIDDYARRVLMKHWPDVPKYGDITQLDGSELAPVDLMAGGFPCQDVSDAGPRTGLDGARSGLWREYVRLIRVVRPRLVLVENVPGLYGRGFGTVLSDLAACGFDAEWDCIPAASVGAPHLRERIWLVAYAHGACGQPAERRELQSGGVRAAHVADAQRQPWPQGRTPDSWDGNPQSQHCQPARSVGALVLDRRPTERTDTWASDAHVDRMAYGIPHRVDRVRGLGNAVVPQVAQFIGERLLAAMESECSTT